MKFTTRNSTYEVDQDNMRIRRLCGVNEPLASQGEDGQWKPYSAIEFVEVGRSALIHWSDKPGGIVTSTITAVEPDVTLPVRNEGPCVSQQPLPVMTA